MSRTSERRDRERTLARTAAASLTACTVEHGLPIARDMLHESMLGASGGSVVVVADELLAVVGALAGRLAELSAQDRRAVLTDAWAAVELDALDRAIKG